jgi:hypothetical protein
MNEFPPTSNPFDDKDISHLQILVYLIPVFGCFPALWTLYHRSGSRQQRRISRLAVTLALGWLAGYALLGVGAEVSESVKVPLMFTNTLFTSGYFLTNLWLMARLYQRRSRRLGEKRE